MSPEAAGWAIPPRDLDPRWVLLGTLAYVVLIVATPVDRWRWLALEGLALAFVLGLSGLRPGAILRRWLGFLMLFGFLAVLVATGHPRRADLGLGPVAAAILAKNSLAFGAVIALAEIVPFPRLLWALGRLGMPAVLAATLHFLYRYLHVLAEEAGRMTQARRARTFRQSGRLDWVRLGGLIGMLFVRSLERGERVHAAMLARGWDGTLRTLDGDDS